jgi:hypothetical protein
MLEGLYNSNPTEAMDDGISPEMFKDGVKDTGGGSGTMDRPSDDNVPDKIPQLAGGGGGNDNNAPPGDGGGGSGDGGSGDSKAKMTQDEKFSLMGMFCKHSLSSLLPPAKMEQLSSNPFAELANINMVRELVKGSIFKTAWDVKTRRMHFYIDESVISDSNTLENMREKNM